MKKDVLPPVDRRGFLKFLGPSIVGSFLTPNMVQLVEQSPGTIEKVASIKNGAEALVELIREVSRLQASTWQQVPALALEADGRTGYSKHYQLAYRKRLWELDTDIDRGYGRSGFGVDLNNGELVNMFSQDPDNRWISSEFVLLLALDMKSIDALQIVEELKTGARQEHWGYQDTRLGWVQSFDPTDQEAWRNKIREEFGLEKPIL